MPMRILRSYMEAMPRVRAAEALRSSTVIAVGSGTMAAQSRDQTLRGWERDANAGRAVVKAQSQEGYRALVRGSGIGFRVVKRKAD
jgi:hypothetical protein